MGKWLVIFIIVVTVFAVILLGLGYLLNENEKKVNAYKKHISQTKVQQKTRENVEDEREASGNHIIDFQSENDLLIAKKQSSINQQIISTNLTCVANEQCMVVSAMFTDFTCQVAVNTIGAAKLAKVNKDLSEVDQCPNYFADAVAVCQNNLCTLNKLAVNR